MQDKDIKILIKFAG